MKRSLKKLKSRPSVQKSKPEFKHQLSSAQLTNAPIRVSVCEEYHAPREYNGPKPPQYIEDAAILRGGRNPFGEPMYRLVWAPQRLSPVGGTWKDYPAGASLADRLSGRAKPIRTAVAVRLKPRYLTAGAVWALERWQPAERYGSRERWFSSAHFGGTMIYVPWANTMVPSMGAYPERGDYEYTNFGFTNEELSESTILTAVGAIESYLVDLPPLAIRIHNTLAQAQLEEDLLSAQMDSLANDMLKEYGPAFGGNPMSGAGPKGRHSSITIAERLGIRSHPDAS